MPDFIINYIYLIEFITKNKVLYKHHFGFRKQHSTNHAVISLVEKLYNALDEGNIAVTYFLDIKKAFDTVDHSIIISKVYNLCIRGPILKWFKSYLYIYISFISYIDRTVLYTINITIPVNTKTREHGSQSSRKLEMAPVR